MQLPLHAFLHTLLTLASATNLVQDFTSNITEPSLSDHTAQVSFAQEFLTHSKAPPSTVLKSFIWAGPGCPTSSSLYAEFDKKSGAFQYYTPRFSVYSDGGDSGSPAAPTDSRKQCTVSFTLEYEAGWQFSLGGAESKGYAGLSAGKSLVQGSYWFSGVSGTENWETTLESPMHEEWYTGYKPNEGRGRWSQCGKSDILNVRMSAYLPPSTDPGVVLLEWTNLYLRWQECEA